jgi:hypothetical protein
MEKKVELTTKDGRVIRAVPHMLEDLSRFGVSQKRPTLKNIPKELLDIPGKTVILKEVKTEAPATDPPLPPMETTEPKRKPPVRSKSTKK